MIVAIITTATIIIMIEALTSGLLDEINRHSSHAHMAFPNLSWGKGGGFGFVRFKKQNGMPIEQSKYSMED